MPEVYTCTCTYQTWLITGHGLIECSNSACNQKYQLPTDRMLTPKEFNNNLETYKID